ncbi:MAG: hypothetical protein AC479_06290 [miscellaneous Crenarchaeota group-6 archaeon AD8-1]|nr:MAG: hypothetical protein AC479_06290 [miscellaneous Crenarchaeota group-6 archaeon AD8-1]
MKKLELSRNKISWKNSGSSIFLVFNSFVWFIFTYIVLGDIITEKITQNELILYSAFFISVSISALIGAKLFPKVRIKAIEAWIILGSISTATLFIFSPSNFLINTIIVVILGISVGAGFPSYLSFFAENTKIENRGFTGGIIWSLVGICVLGFAALYMNFDMLQMVTLLTIWRFFGWVGFKSLNKNRQEIDVQKAPSYLELLTDRKILLYLFPWIMFTIINFAETPIVQELFGSEFLLMQLVTWFFVGVFAVIGGYLADIVGRKKVVIAGFIMLGLEYAALSVFSASNITLYSYAILDGISWGLLFSVFFMSLWGDLGQYHIKEKYYVLGGLPYLLANFLYVLINPIVPYIDDPSIAFTFASFFLFLAILPLVYAPETLPEKKIRERELKNYVVKAQKIREKYS